jgi:hypothetical protein
MREVLVGRGEIHLTARATAGIVRVARPTCAA